MDPETRPGTSRFEGNIRPDTTNTSVSAPSGTEIEIERGGLHYATSEGPLEALRGINARFEPGEFVALLGPSGCGKTSLLMAVAGLVALTEGEIRVGGKSVTAPVTEVGIAFQDPTLLPWRSVRDNVLLQREMRKLSRAPIESRTREMLDSVGLWEFADRYPHELSGGMRQRASLVRALVHEPPLLLLDEPFGALDAITRDQMVIDLQRLWIDRRPTVLFVTHSMDEAIILSDRVLVFSPRPGRIVKEIKVGMDRPRGLGDRESPEFISMIAAVRETFLSEGVLHA